MIPSQKCLNTPVKEGPVLILPYCYQFIQDTTCNAYAEASFFFKYVLWLHLTRQPQTFCLCKEPDYKYGKSLSCLWQSCIGYMNAMHEQTELLGVEGGSWLILFLLVFFVFLKIG